MKKIVIAALSFWQCCAGAWAGNLVLWYQQPTESGSPFINQALPVGNGRLGALIDGGIAQERLALNEDSLWTGGDNPSGNDGTMGAYQALGDLLVTLPEGKNATRYRRELDLNDAVARVQYELDGVTFSRECFCSHPDGVLVLRFQASKPGCYSGVVSLKDSHHGTIVAANNRLTDTGALQNKLKYETQLMALNTGGSVQARDAMLVFTNCDSLTLILAAGTDYAMDYARNYRGEDPHADVSSRIEIAAAKTFENLETAHLQDYHALFNRVRLDLGASSPAQAAMPTDQRKVAATEKFDPGLENLLFQYGRYLLISCSRPGGLPANLQGLWNDSDTPPWHSDYHANINVEMNYWPAEPANLSECAEPFFALVQSQLPAWRKATANAQEFQDAQGKFAGRGFAIRTSHNIYGGMGWKWDDTANAWYCRHFYEHYAFTGDVRFLKESAYPILKETCQFWEDHLKTLPDGRLVVPHGWSPEHGPEEDGVNYSQEIIWDLFQNYVEASSALDIDPDYRNKIASLRDHLAQPGIGSWGQLLEWMHEQHNPKYPELDTPSDHHRHTSHLFAVYPGRQITVAQTPALAAAAKVSLDARGDTGDVREWSFAWRAALYARLRDGDDAHRELRQFFANRNSCPNLFGLHPPMQMDGNFGVTAAVAEMLLQSQDGPIDLLPALPDDWKDGSFTGLCARGALEVDAAWSNGRLTSAVIHSITGGPCIVKYKDKTIALTMEKGQSITLNAALKTP